MVSACSGRSSGETVVDADGPLFGHNRRPEQAFAGAHGVDGVSQGLRGAFWLQSMACGHRSAYECIAAFSAADCHPDLVKIDVPSHADLLEFIKS